MEEQSYLLSHRMLCVEQNKKYKIELFHWELTKCQVDKTTAKKIGGHWSSCNFANLTFIWFSCYQGM